MSGSPLIRDMQVFDSDLGQSVGLAPPLLIRGSLRGELPWARCAEAYEHMLFLPAGTDDQRNARRPGRPVATHVDLPTRRRCVAEDAMDDPAATGLCKGSDVGLLAVVGIGIDTGVDDVALQLTIARPRTTTVITRNE